MEIPKLINKDVFITNETVNEQEDVYIADIFSGMRFSMPFINYFIKQGKTMMSQLTETDIIDAVNIRGVGKFTAEKLYRIYSCYINKNLPANIDEELERIHVEKVFDSSSKEALFIERYHGSDVLNLLELKNIFISAAVLEGVIPSYVEEKFIQLLVDSETFNSNVILSPLFSGEDIPPENKGLPIEYLKQGALTDSEIILLKKYGYKAFEDLINASFSLKIYRC